MAGIGTTGIILLVLVALLLFGPNKLPELGRALGRTMKEFKSGARDLIDEDDRNKDKAVTGAEAQLSDNSEKNNKRLPD